MQEEVDQKTIALAVKTGKLTAQVLQAAIRKYLAARQKGTGKAHHGQQSLRQLKKDGSALSNIEITDANIGLFKPCAKKWQTLYWRIELYVVKQDENKKTEFLSPEYTYIMDKNGEIPYFIHERRSLNYLKGRLGSMVENQFYSACPNLNLPVPYQPGDVLFIDCRPYAPGAFYCLLKEVGDDCCGIQCEYVDEKGNLETGALKHGDYFFNHGKVYQYLSPLYRAKVVSKDELNWDDYVRRKQKC